MSYLASSEEVTRVREQRFSKKSDGCLKGRGEARDTSIGHKLARNIGCEYRGRKLWVAGKRDG